MDRQPGVGFGGHPGILEVSMTGAPMDWIGDFHSDDCVRGNESFGKLAEINLRGVFGSTPLHLVRSNREQNMADRETSSVQLGLPIPPESGIHRLARVPVRLTIRLCHETMKLKDLAAIAPGVCLRFDVTCDTPAELFAGQSSLATGETIRSGDRLGIRVNRLQSGYEIPKR